ncbi:TIM barrel protein [Sphaerotilus mobilis]|uniref:2-keto-myo-inositol isomerase n=1 Tax=Sphaerotilus mobilis TaxID=47994 RepID=A0A4Q7LFV8_9BURK|nr:TIM barrel protein [Sphaerotilus mobilis]RZS52901.1 2-keto-myo-inositol isomerase [Sphaerotilus mobilis]
MSALRFCLNRMSAPRMSFEAYAAMARRLGIAAIEIRNDLSGVEITDGTPAATVGAIARDHGLVIRSINALQRFEQFTAEREAEAVELARYARDCGAEALVLCPTNSRSDARSADQRHDALVHALTSLKPILADHGIVGLVEPLGFEECAVRRKSQAVRAFEDIGADATFGLVHDTFHHHLAGEGLFFPQWTGLIHISGVEDSAVTVPDMRDGHRVLVGASDRLANPAQIRRLLDAGYAGLVSFEPFAASVAASASIEAELAASMAWLNAAVADAQPA